MKQQIEEVIDIGFFALDNLPQPIVSWYIPQIEDALGDIGGGTAGRSTVITAEKTESRAELYALRDRSGMTRSEFHQYYFESHPGNRFDRDIEKK